jgi:RNA polymerase sigma factor (sigma-70 family)
MPSVLVDSLLNHLGQLSVFPAQHHLADEELLDRFVRQRDQAAFAALVQRHGPLVLRVCQRVLRDHHATEDAFQATFLVLVRKAASLERRDLLSSWLYGVAHRIALRAREATAQRQARERQAARHTSADPMDELTGRELYAALDEELQRLPEPYRAPLLLCCLQGRTRDEAARQLRWSLGTLKRRLERGRALLHDRLARRGLIPAAVLATGTLAPAAGSATVPAALIVQTLAATRDVGAASARALALAREALPGTLVARVTAGAALCLVLGLLAGGAGIVVRQVHTPQPAVTAAEPPPAPPSTARTDRFGDPLPAGALVRLGTLRFRHGAQVRAILFTPDDQLLIAAGTDDTICFLDRQTGRQLRRLAGHEGAIVALALSPDGCTLASAGEDGTARLWDVATGKERHCLRGHGKYVRAVAFTPDGQNLVTAGLGQTARFWTVCLWDVGTGGELRHFVGHQGDVTAMAISTDGKHLVAGGREGDGRTDHTVRVWELGTGKELRQLGRSADSIRTLTFAPDGKTLLTLLDSGELQLWDFEKGELRATLKVADSMRGLMSAVFSPDGRRLAVLPWDSGSDATVRVWSVPSLKEEHRFRCPRDTVSMAFNPNGKILALANGSALVHLWDVATKKELPVEGLPMAPRSLAFSPDGQFLFSGSEDGTARRWEVATGKELRDCPELTVTSSVAQ